jgi:hypothetical protein
VGAYINGAARPTWSTTYAQISQATAPHPTAPDDTACSDVYTTTTLFIKSNHALYRHVSQFLVKIPLVMTPSAEAESGIPTSKRRLKLVTSLIDLSPSISYSPAALLTKPRLRDASVSPSRPTQTEANTPARKWEVNSSRKSPSTEKMAIPAHVCVQTLFPSTPQETPTDTHGAVRKVGQVPLILPSRVAARSRTRCRASNESPPSYTLPQSNGTLRLHV